MSTQGIEMLAIETHNWGKTVAFWEALGFKLEFETGHGSGQLVAPNGTRLFVVEKSPQEPVSVEVFLAAATAGPTPEGVDVAFDWTATHWGTQLLTVRDPDGRLFRLQAPAEPSGTTADDA